MSYSWDKFLRPLSSTDTNIQIMDNNGIMEVEEVNGELKFSL